MTSLVTIKIDGKQVPLPEAKKILRIPDEECAGCWLGDASPDMHDLGYGCEYGEGAGF